MSQTARYALTETEAERRFETFKDVDPYPEVPAALLNSADIADYVAATGMVTPFRDQQEHLKPASFEVPLLGKYVFWDGDGKKVTGTIENGQKFYLPANSIAFVTLQPTFRIPNYIAVRFNLRITHIYRGVLLGTGPLVDPGFQGKLSIPLHNLTVNDYPLTGGKGLIWMEFTKLSPFPRRSAESPSPPPEGDGSIEPPRRDGPINLLEQEKADLEHDVEYYLEKAWNGPIRSSIPAATKQASDDAERSRVAAENAQESADKQRRLIQTVSVVTLTLGLLTVIGTLIMLLQLVDGMNSRVDGLSRSLAMLEAGSVSGDVQNGGLEDVAETISDLDANLNRYVDRGVVWLSTLTVLVLVMVMLVVGARHVVGSRPSAPDPSSSTDASPRDGRREEM